MNKAYIFILVFAIFSSCEDVVEIDNGFEASQLVVDAWLDNMEREQVVRITDSQNYFDSAFAKSVSGAKVTLKIDGQADIDFEDQGDGNYTWTPGDQKIGIVGDTYTLVVEVNGETYQGVSAMKRVPVIDSIAQVFEEEQLGFPEGIYAELYATDFVGENDSYWVKTWKNEQLLNKPLEILVVYDATFDAGSSLDGVPFIFPIRRGINPIPDEVDNIDDLPPPYAQGDSLYVELHSITNGAFRFWVIAQEQMINGDNGIFALPVANTRSNMVKVSSGDRILGYFNVSAVSTSSAVIE